MSSSETDTLPLGVRIRKAVLRLPVLSVFVLVGLWNVSVSSNVVTRNLEGPGGIREVLREIRNVNLHLQLRVYQFLTSGRPIGLQPKDVTIIYLDDDTELTQLRGTQPTDRAYLAKLVTALATPPAHAGVIALDFELIAPRGYEDGSDHVSRLTGNAELLTAIQYANSQKIPVILGGAYFRDGNINRRVPTLFTDSELHIGALTPCPRCAQYGYLNAPSDKRLVPSSESVDRGGKDTIMSSFAFAAEEAFRDPEDKQNPTEKGEKEDEPIFGTFLPESKYHSITALQFENNASAREFCDNRIVLIGAHWHDLQGYGDLVDTHLSPAGTISGIGLHANYIESLYQKQFAHELSVWVDIVLDLLLGLIIYISFELAYGWRVVIVLALAFVVPFACAYVALVTTNRYLDFLFPVELYFLHVVYELLEDYLHTKRHSQPEKA